MQGCEFAHRFFERKSDVLRLAHGCSFVKSNGSESLNSLFKKKRLERFALGHKNGKKLSKTYKKYEYERIARFWRENHSHRSFLKREKKLFALKSERF